MCCETCPWALTDRSEQAQNYGCLPTPQEIMAMKRDTGRNWACHDDESRICAGFVEACQEQGVPYKGGGELIRYSTWYHEGPPA